MFGFEDQSAMFDVTPVENQFILEYMPDSRGDYVKVYLYGLMQCYHPQSDMSLTQMARELGMEEEEVRRAFRHWELRNLVRKVSDDPPRWTYLNLRRQMMAGPISVDAEYASFAEAVYALFGSERKVDSRDVALAYEWVEEEGLPSEVVIMMLRNCMETRGKHFSFKAAQKVAARMAEENVHTVEDAEAFFQRDRNVFDGAKKVLRRLGKRRDPSEDEQQLFVKWTHEWGFSPDAVLAACAETVKGEPTFAYLGGILQGMKERNGNQAMTSAAQVENTLSENRDAAEPLKKLFAAMNLRGMAVSSGTLSLYAEMRKLYPDDVICMAGSECAAHRRSPTMDDVISMLESWKNDQHLDTAEEVREFLDRYHNESRIFEELYQTWGISGGVPKNDRLMLRRWMTEYRFSREMILFCAERAAGKEHPAAYLDSILKDYAEKGIRTVEAAAEEQKHFRASAEQKAAAAPAAPRGGKVVTEQQYTQREYGNPTGIPEWKKKMLEEMNTDAQ